MQPRLRVGLLENDLHFGMAGFRTNQRKTRMQIVLRLVVVLFVALVVVAALGIAARKLSALVIGFAASAFISLVDYSGAYRSLSIYRPVLSHLMPAGASTMARARTVATMAVAFELVLFGLAFALAAWLARKVFKRKTP